MCPMCLCVSIFFLIRPCYYLLVTKLFIIELLDAHYTNNSITNNLITNSANLEKKFILVLYFKHLVFLQIRFLTDIYDD
jgi:hypothetical protein